MKTSIIFDINNLAWRAYYTTGSLKHQGKSTGVAYGVLRTIKETIQDFEADNVAFCFDSRSSLRKLLLPDYKSNRADKEKERKAIAKAVKELRIKILPSIGFKNLLLTKGYEADDLMAKLVHCKTLEEKMVLVSGDQDLYQLLRKRVIIYDPRYKRIHTEKKFTKEYGIRPDQWTHIKEIAGCTSDCVKGVKGIALKTALLYVKRKLSPKSKAYQKILKWKLTNKQVKTLACVRLPLWFIPREGEELPHMGLQCKRLEYPKKVVDKKKWNEVVESMGMKSLRW